MAADETFICNQALGLLGSSRIMALSDDSKEARFCKRFYGQTRDEVIAEHRWNFAIVRTTLSELTGTPNSEWAKRFQVPENCLRVLQVNGFDVFEPNRPFSVEGRCVLSDDAEVRIKYLARVEDANLYPPIFIEALAVKLASKLAQPITGSRDLPSRLLEEYERVTGPKARRVDAIEGRPKVKPAWVTSDLVRERFGGR